jgi:SPP1 gp7 family putative phage head morphogenesis protein
MTDTRLDTLMRRFYPLILERAFGDASLAGIPVAFDLDNPAIQDALDQLAREVQSITETTRADIQALVGRQAAEGWSVEQLADAIAGLAGEHSAARATAIARTETARAYSLGSVTAFRESGVVSAIEWLTAPTDACPICAPLNGQRTALDTPFSGGIPFPPAHTNCRCTILPVVE